MAVYGIDLGLVPVPVVHARRRERAKGRGRVREPVDVAVRLDPPAAHGRARAGPEGRHRPDQRRDWPPPAEGLAPEPQGAAIGGAAGDVQFAQMQERMLETFDALERDQRGYSTANALMAVVSSMRNVPGRKAIVFFSEGLSIPTNVQERFVAVVAAANRANVSIYSVDAAGLRTESTTKETYNEQMAAAQRTLCAQPDGRHDRRTDDGRARAQREQPAPRPAQRPRHAGRPDRRPARVEHQRLQARPRARRQRPAQLLHAQLRAEQRGVRRALPRDPREGEPPRARGAAPQGLLTPCARPAGAPVLSYEAPALAWLDKTPVPNAFPVRATALRFPEPGHTGLTPVVVEVPTASLTFQPAPDDAKKYRSDATVLVRFSNDARRRHRQDEPALRAAPGR